MDWRKFGIYGGLTALFLATNGGQFWWWKSELTNTKAKYEKEIGALKATLQQIGPITAIWCVKRGVGDIFPGKKIEESDLEIRQIPSSFITDGYVLDPGEVVGKYFKVSLGPGSPLLKELVMVDAIDDTTREFDITASVMPIGMKVGDYIDLRLVYPLGEDYIVLPHKRIEAIQERTVKLKMNEQEIHLYQGAVVDYYLQSQKGSSLYMAKYIEPGVQKPADKYYAVPKNIIAIMTADPNMLNKVNAGMNDSIRKMIDANNNVTTEVGSVINSGRNDLKSKVDQATQADMQKRKREEEMKAQQQQMNPTPQLPPPSPPPTNLSNPSAPKGVVN